MDQVGTAARRAFVARAHEGWGSLLVTGPDRCTWLDGLVTCSVKGLEPGQACQGLALNRHGKVQSPVFALQAEKALHLGLESGKARELLAHLDPMLIMEDAEISVPEPPERWLSLHGPESVAVASQWAGTYGGQSAALDFLGLGGAILALPEAGWARFEAEQAPRLTPEQWKLLRLERQFPQFGVDYDERHRPHEAGLERKAVDWSKGCYLGQEVVCMQDMRGKVKRHCRVIAIDAPPQSELSEGSLEIRSGDQLVTQPVTTLAYSPDAGRWLAFAMIQTDREGSALRAHAGDRDYPASLAEVV